MREMIITLAGKEIALSLTWKTMCKIKDRVVDPVLLATEAVREAEALQAGKEYTPKVEFNTDVAIKIVSLASGKDVDDIGELFVENGIFESQAEVGNYLAALIGSKSGKGDKDASAGN